MDTELLKDPCRVSQAIESIVLESFTYRYLPLEGIEKGETEINGNGKRLVEIFTTLKTASSKFYETCHSSCIQGFRITDGIIIMLISIAACNDGVLLCSFSNHAPYFKFDSSKLDAETKIICEAWKSFELKIGEMAVMHLGLYLKLREITNISVEMEKIFDILESVSPNPDENVANNKKMVAQAIVVAERIINEVKVIDSIMQTLIKQLKFNKQEIENYGKIAAAKKAYSAERIIHEILLEERNIEP